jgi:allophanate hydrolase subunit 1
MAKNLLASEWHIARRTDIVEHMTKVQIRFRLQTPLAESAYQSIATAHSIYGIHRITIAPSLQELTVEYDATRLRPAEVEAALAGVGIPVERIYAQV